MTDRELNEGVARAMGWSVVHLTNGDLWTSPDGKHRGMGKGTPPDFLHDPRAFMDLLLWHAREGREPSVEARDPAAADAHLYWCATLWTGVGQFLCQNGDTPARALALATVAWKEGAK